MASVMRYHPTCISGILALVISLSLVWTIAVISFSVAEKQSNASRPRPNFNSLQTCPNDLLRNIPIGQVQSNSIRSATNLQFPLPASCIP